MPDGRPVELVDLPGAYSLDPTSPDEEVTRDVVLGKQQGERLPDALLIVLDATNLDNHLRFALQLIELGLPTVVALNMIDLAKRDGLELDPGKLEAELGVPVIETVAVRKRGLDELVASLGELLIAPRRIRAGEGPSHDPLTLQRRARDIAMRRDRQRNPGPPPDPPPRRGAAPPVAGPLILARSCSSCSRRCSPGANAGRLDRSGADARSARRIASASGRLSALADRRRRDRRRRRGDRVPAADPDPVPVHPGARERPATWSARPS